MPKIYEVVTKWGQEKEWNNWLLVPLASATNLQVAFFNWDSLLARLNSHYEAWSYKKKKHKKIKAYRKSV